MRFKQTLKRTSQLGGGGGSQPDERIYRGTDGGWSQMGGQGGQMG